MTGGVAMLLAAGLGLRMRPLTETTPKPLLTVKGRALIDYGHDHLRTAGVLRAVVNAHYLPEQIEAWAARQSHPPVAVSDERGVILDTGGGIVKAISMLGAEPFFVLNCDSFWVDEGRPALERLREVWNGSTMDCLLLLSPVEKTVGYDGKGDFHVDGNGRLSRRRAGETRALVYIGGYLVHPRLFANAPEGKFSMNALWNTAIAAGRLYGLEHQGLWLHVGTPEAIAAAEARV